MALLFFYLLIHFYRNYYTQRLKEENVYIVLIATLIILISSILLDLNFFTFTQSNRATSDQDNKFIEIRLVPLVDSERMIRINDGTEFVLPKEGMYVLNFVEFQCRSCIIRLKNWNKFKKEWYPQKGFDTYHLFTNSSRDYIKIILNEMEIDIENNFIKDPNMLFTKMNHLKSNSIILVNDNKILTRNYRNFKNILAK